VSISAGSRAFLTHATLPPKPFDIGLSLVTTSARSKSGRVW
jgi:hypothetical protein